MSKSTQNLTGASSYRLLPTSESLGDCDFTYTSRTENGPEIIKSIQSMQSLLSDLESSHDFAEVLKDSTVSRRLKDMKRSSLYENSESKTWREIAYSKMDDSQQKLGELARSLVDSVDGLLGEGQRQMQCLGDIEDLLSMLEPKTGSQHKEPIKSPSAEVVQAIKSSEKIFKLMVAPTITGKTAEKGVQNGKPAEESLLLQDMDRQHLYQMLDAFHNLRFSLEILTPGKTIKPHPSKLRLEGTLSELNYELASLTVDSRLNLRSLTGPALARVSITAQPTKLNTRTHRPQGDIQAFKTVITEAAKRTSILGSGFGSDLEFNFHLSLLNIAPALTVQTRPFPRYYLREIKAKYDKLTYIQWKMPELADLFFNIDDLLPMTWAKDRFHAEYYFLMDKQHKTLENQTQVNRDVSQRVALYTYICRHRRQLRDIFVSYNLEAMQLVKDILSMNFATYMRLLKDFMLLTPEFDVIAAVKIFYKSTVHTKKIPDFTEGNEKKWLTDLLRSFNFEDNYRLKLPGFIESLVRISCLHPRYAKMVRLSPVERFMVFYKRVVKPNVRLVLGMHYRELLSDMHVIDTLSQFEPDLQNIFTAYQLKLPEKSLLLDFKGRHLQLSLSHCYHLFGDSRLLKPGEITGQTVDTLEADLAEIRDDEVSTFHEKKPKVVGALKQIFSRNRATTQLYRPTVIRFPSSSTANYKNHSERLKTNPNLRSILLPFARPLANRLLLDRFQLFTFFISVHEVLGI